MDNILQFLSEQSIIISAIIVVVALIVQDLLAEKKGIQFELSPEEAAVMIFKGAKLYDIREKEDYKTAHIDQAVWHNASQLEMYPEKNLKPTKEYILYCSNGSRSGELANLLRQKSGFKTYFIKQGLEAWKEAGMKIKTTGANT